MRTWGVWLGVAQLSLTVGATTAPAPAGPPPGPAMKGASVAEVAPEQPAGMASGPGGSLYIVDPGRDQVLCRLPGGRFEVVAGTGRRGFSGDGGPAVDADIDVDYQAGIAVAGNGVVYFADDRDNRVREILPDGTIETVAGGGTTRLGVEPVRALQASFPHPFGLFGLTMGPGGELYIGTSAVYRLTPGGMLYWVVGSALPSLNKGFKSVFSNPGAETDFAPATRPAFDAKGDLLVAGGGGFGLYEKTSAGRLRFIENFRGAGYWGSLSPDPNDGGVVLAGGANAPAIFHPSGAITLAPARGLSEVLGRRGSFRVGAGVAATDGGEIYLDADAGNGFTSVSAIVSVLPSGRVSVVWKS